MKTHKNKSRHGKNAEDQIKLSCKVDVATWRRVHKKAEAIAAATGEEKDVAAYLRGLITEAVWDVSLTDKDFDIIKKVVAQRKAREELETLWKRGNSTFIPGEKA